MLETDPALFLARAQFAFTLSFHIVFPALSIGLASYLAVLEALWLGTKRAVFLDIYKFWLKIFAVAFAMGVVSGVVMSYEFGTNWGQFAEKTAPVLGPLLAYEVLTAFFLEAGFLGVMLFGLERVGKKLHFTATLLVAVGTLTSSFWILAANSWMQTPAGFHMEDGRFVPTSWLEVIFNPSFPYRLVHMVLAAYLATAFVVGAVGAWHLLKDRASRPARIMFGMAVVMAAVVAPLQLFVGDQHGLNTEEYQPAKIAAMEGHFETMAGAPLILFGIPDMEEGRMKAVIAIPKLGSLILKHDPNGTVTGLDAFPKSDWPSVPVLFTAFRIMVGIGMLMILYGLCGLVLAWRRRLFAAGWYHRIAVIMAPAGLIALLAGWFVTEVGRQPYVVYGRMRTVDAVSPIGLPGVSLSLLGFIIVYLIVFSAGTVYMLRLMRLTPGAAPSAPEAPLPLAAEMHHPESSREERP